MKPCPLLRSQRKRALEPLGRVAPTTVLSRHRGLHGRTRDFETHKILAVLHTDPMCHGDDSLDQRSVMLCSDCSEAWLACAMSRRSRIARQSTSDPLKAWTRKDAQPSARSRRGASDMGETARTLPRTRKRDVLLSSFNAERSCAAVESDVVNARIRL